MKIRIKAVDVSDIGLIGRDFYYVQVSKWFKWKTLRKCLGEPAIFVCLSEAEKFLQGYVEDCQQVGVKVTVAPGPSTYLSTSCGGLYGNHSS